MLEGPIRKISLQITNSHRWKDEEKLKEQSMEVVSSSNKDGEAYKSVLEKAEKANNLEPNTPDIHATLGVA
jgi:hypothetical protein